MGGQVASSRRGWAWALALTLVAAGAGSAGAAITPAQASTVSPLRHAIVFTRFLPGAGTGNVYRIDAGGTAAHLIRPRVLDYALMSPDATQVTDFALAPDGRGSACIFNVDGSGYRVLPIPDPTLELFGGTWSAGDSRIAAFGADPNNPARAGLYSRQSSDGSGLIRLTHAGTRADYPIQSSPDGSKLL